MPALPTGIVTQLTGGEQPKPRLKQAYLALADPDLPDKPPWEESGGTFGAIAFQYWPETVTDSRQVEWNPRSIPGGSHPIYQWTQSGERRIAFTAVFTTDFEPKGSEESGEGGAPPSPGEKLRQVDVAAAVSWLRWFTYPYYQQDDVRVFEPAKAELVLPGSRIAFNGTDAIVCVMTQCEVTYEAFFPNGAPRIVEVALEFAETVQSSGSVKFQSRDQMKTSAAVGNVLAPFDEEGGSGNLLDGVAGAIDDPANLGL